MDGLPVRLSGTFGDRVESMEKKLELTEEEIQERDELNQWI